MKHSPRPVRALLVSCYELGRQSFALGSAAAWLRREGAEVRLVDTALDPLERKTVLWADLIAFHVPMHTATRLAGGLLAQVREANPKAHICCFGLYASLNADFLREQGAGTILGGEFEAGLASLLRRLTDSAEPAPQPEPLVSLARQDFLVPDRGGLPELSRYAQLRTAAGALETVGYTETTRGCKHRCRHCPVVPVYDGAFRVVQREVVLEDIRRQVAAGARHVTFGDPDFFNGPGHARAIVEAVHDEFPSLTYDVTIKVEHLLKHADLLPTLKRTGCLFVTSAVESVDERVLTLLDKGHAPGDLDRVVALFQRAGLILNPTFVAFTPWTGPASYAQLLDRVESLGLVEHVAPVQWAIRLLIPAGSRLLELPEIASLVGVFDQRALCYPWSHPDPRMDVLQRSVERLVQQELAAGADRREIFRRVRADVDALEDACCRQSLRAAALAPPEPVVRVPYLTEPWYC